MNSIDYSPVIMLFAIIIIIFLVVLYLKQNKQGKLLKDIQHLLEMQLRIANLPQGDGSKECWNCGKRHPKNTKICPDCGNNI